MSAESTYNKTILPLKYMNVARHWKDVNYSDFVSHWAQLHVYCWLDNRYDSSARQDAVTRPLLWEIPLDAGKEEEEATSAEQSVGSHLFSLHRGFLPVFQIPSIQIWPVEERQSSAAST